MIYRCQQGEVLDSICFGQFGRVDVVGQVLEDNPHLADLGVILPTGTLVVLPDKVDFPFVLNQVPMFV